MVKIFLMGNSISIVACLPGNDSGGIGIMSFMEMIVLGGLAPALGFLPWFDGSTYLHGLFYGVDYTTICIVQDGSGVSCLRLLEPEGEHTWLCFC
jgi:hypothetical protein